MSIALIVVSIWIMLNLALALLLSIFWAWESFWARRRGERYASQ